MAFPSPHRPELWKCFTLLILSVLVFVTRNFTETNTLPGLYFRCLSSLRGIHRNQYEQFGDIFEFLQKGLKLCMNERLGFATFGMITERFHHSLVLQMTLLHSTIS